uniref:Uncharacterized protein n=1 Tax=Mammaliicoccus phage MSShimriz1 TaxID=3230127 RepID=A0AAU8GTD0_9VIRU
MSQVINLRENSDIYLRVFFNTRGMLGTTL